MESTDTGPKDVTWACDVRNLASRKTNPSPQTNRPRGFGLFKRWGIGKRRVGIQLQAPQSTLLDQIGDSEETSRYVRMAWAQGPPKTAVSAAMVCETLKRGGGVKARYHVKTIKSRHDPYSNVATKFGSVSLVRVQLTVQKS
jgi:hypothetical protein